MTPGEPCFDHSVFRVNRARLNRLDVTKKFSDRIVLKAMEHNLLSDDHFSIDGSLLQSHASLKSLKHIEELQRAAEQREKNEKDDSDDDDGQGPPALRVGNPWIDFRGEKRSNDTHRSTTDPEARLYTKTGGVAYLQHTMHVMTENRHGLAVDITVGPADGYAERECALTMLDQVKRCLGIRPTTLAADKGYDAGGFLVDLESREVEPHVACKSETLIKHPRTKDEQKAAEVWARRDNQCRRRSARYGVSQRNSATEGIRRRFVGGTAWRP